MRPMKMSCLSTAIGHGHVDAIVSGHRDENLVLRSQIAEIRIGKGRAGLGLLRFARPDGGDLLGLRIGKRPQKDRTDYAEDRGIGTDAQCEGHDGDRAEARILQQHARGVLKIFQEGAHASEIRRAFVRALCRRFTLNWMERAESADTATLLPRDWVSYGPR